MLCKDSFRFNIAHRMQHSKNSSLASIDILKDTDQEFSINRSFLQTYYETLAFSFGLSDKVPTTYCTLARNAPQITKATFQYLITLFIEMTVLKIPILLWHCSFCP
ncbi:hypothetical protein CEXT_688961 [Caerostris extrusa]|uniref:Uncharacterized protein n=1 Tax=Caerostris extrusa TaxID=172846 RepID=A0AAV4QXM9_CAEEX|nr:hypothetical protein CEXT_688961 [Caerostris extrusa]